MIDYDPRCWRCQKKLAEHTARPWAIVCLRCRARNASPPAEAIEQAAVVREAQEMAARAR